MFYKKCITLLIASITFSAHGMDGEHADSLSDSFSSSLSSSSSSSDDMLSVDRDWLTSEQQQILIRKYRKLDKMVKEQEDYLEATPYKPKSKDNKAYNSSLADDADELEVMRAQRCAVGMLLHSHGSYLIHTKSGQAVIKEFAPTGNVLKRKADSDERPAKRSRIGEEKQ